MSTIRHPRREIAEEKVEIFLIIDIVTCKDTEIILRLVESCVWDPIEGLEACYRTGRSKVSKCLSISNELKRSQGVTSHNDA